MFLFLYRMRPVIFPAILWLVTVFRIHTVRPHSDSYQSSKNQNRWLFFLLFSIMEIIQFIKYSTWCIQLLIQR